DEFYLGATRRTDGGDASSRRARESAPRRAAGKTFYCRSDIWVEATLPDDWQKDCTRVVAFSDEYFALLAAHPELREAFALGASVALRIGTKVVLTVAEAVAEAPIHAAPVATPSGG
ncbi:MAG: hypothetical protein ABL997_14480, partial [Planctomycetota bacterium]